MLTSIKTARLFNKKQVTERRNKIETLEADLNSANEKFAEQGVTLTAEKAKTTALQTELKTVQDKLLEKENALRQISENNEPEKLLREVMTSDGKIDGSFLRYILKTKDLNDEFTIGKIRLRRIFMGEGKYQCRLIS